MIRRLSGLWRHVPTRRNNNVWSRRQLLDGSIGAIRWHGGPKVSSDAPTITLTFIQPDETTKQVQALVGESFLQTAHRNDIDLEGACEGGRSNAKLGEKLF